MKAIQKGDDTDLIDASLADPELVQSGTTQTYENDENLQTKLLRTSLIAKWMTGLLTLALLILWPFPMFGSSYVFSKSFFTGWVTIGIIWVFAAFICVGIYPIVEGHQDIWHTLKAIFRDITGKRQPKVYQINGVSFQNDGSISPSEKVKSVIHDSQF
jgi:hypothetical protein